MKKIILVVLIVLVCILAAYVIENGGVYSHQLKWQSANISHYRFRLSLSCFCEFTLGGPYPTIEVRNGKTISITDENGSAITNGHKYYNTFSQYGTIDKLFSILRSNSVREADEVTVKYDPTYGFPSEIYINPSKPMWDDQTTYYVSGFEILP